MCLAPASTRLFDVKSPLALSAIWEFEMVLHCRVVVPMSSYRSTLLQNFGFLTSQPANLCLRRRPPALSSLLLLSTNRLSFVYTDSTGSVALYSTSVCRTPPFMNKFTLVSDVCGTPVPAHDPLNTTIESYIIDKRPTCSDGHIPTFYTYEDAARYQGEVKRPQIGFESDTSCVKSAQSLAVAFICNGLRNADGNEWENLGGADDRA